MLRSTKHIPTYFGILTAVFLFGSCNLSPDPEPEPEVVDPCDLNPGTTLSFGNLIYEYDELGWPISITSKDTSGSAGDDYRIYRYGGGIMTYTELSLENGTYWSWDSLNCNGSSCTHYLAQSDTMCPITGGSQPCELSMTLNIGNWVLTDGETTYHYSQNSVLDSITYSTSKFIFQYFQGRPVNIFELNNNADTVAIQTFTYNSSGQWRAFERQDLISGQVNMLKYIYDTDGRISMVSIGYGIPPITLTDYPATQEGCGDAPRNLDPLNLYRLPHMHFRYIGMPW